MGISDYAEADYKKIPTVEIEDLEVTSPATITSYADNSVAATSQELISAANANRREIILQNPASNTSDFRIADTNAGAARGLALAPGASLVLNTSGAVYAYNTGASAQNIIALELIGA